jgi:aspartyl-tRNA(Asn)/glutamyl-tRNA(Gln) amidotransferase subunit A
MQSRPPCSDNEGQCETSTAGDHLPLTITAGADALRAGRLTSVGLTEAVQARADVVDPALGCFVTRAHDLALTEAARADRELTEGLDRGPLHGIPFGIKDVFTTRGLPTTAQSQAVEPGRWGEEDADAVALLRRAGAVVVGKTTTMEFALGAPSRYMAYPASRNPFVPDHWAGGSSSGSGSGVAAGLFLGALGSDTGGSIRLPAAWCGVTGLKPTKGRISTRGCIPLSVSLDTVGPLARSARDCADILTALATPDLRDPAAPSHRAVDPSLALEEDLEGVRIGVDRRLLRRCPPESGVAALADAALDKLASVGATIVEQELPMFDEIGTAASAVLHGEAAAYHLDNLQARWVKYGRSTREALAYGLLMSAADLVRCQQLVQHSRRMVADLFEHVHLIATPTSLAPAPRIDSLVPGWHIASLCTHYWNAADCPTVSIPIGPCPNSIPAGLQLTGPRFADAFVLRAADIYQRRTKHHLLEPPLIDGLLE